MRAEELLDDKPVEDSQALIALHTAKALDLNGREPQTRQLKKL